MAASHYPLLELGTRAELRAWLAENHASSKGVELVIGKKGNPVVELSYDDAVEEGLAFGWIDSVGHRLDENRFSVRFTPRRKHGSPWARSNKERVARLTEAGLMTPAGLAAVEAAKADGSWDVLTDVDNLVVPPDLAQALSEAGAAEKFEGLSASQRRMALYWIAGAKRAETRAKRISATVDAAREGRGPV